MLKTLFTSKLNSKNRKTSLSDWRVRPSFWRRTRVLGLRLQPGRAMLLVDLQVRTNLITQMAMNLTTMFSVYLHFSIHRDTQVIKWNFSRWWRCRRVNDDERALRWIFFFFLVFGSFTQRHFKTITSRMPQKCLRYVLIQKRDSHFASISSAEYISHFG
jgi:hypothetical protein